MRDFIRTRGGRTFLAVWGGQLVSNTGSAMTTFGLAIWVFRETGSATRLAVIVLAAQLPMLIMSPFAGTLVDRWNRRTAMIVADAGAAAGTLVAVVLLATGTLRTWNLIIILAVGGMFAAFQFPAYSAATTLLVPKVQYTRAAGLVQLAGSVAMVIAPTMAAALVATSGLTAIFVIDLASFAVAVGTLLAVRFPEPHRTSGPTPSPQTLLAEARIGLRFVTARRGLLVLLVTFSVVAFAFSFQSVLLVPLLLTATTETTAGLVVSASALGIVAGSLLMSVWGGPNDRLRGLFLALGATGLGFIVAGMSPMIGLLLAGISLVHLVHPIAGSLNQAVWQSKVPPALQGRVFAVRQVMVIAATPVAYLLAGQLADRVFEPLMVGRGRFATAIGGIIGTGPGRGIGLLFVLMGLTVAVAAAVGWSRPAIRDLDTTVPDVELADEMIPA